MFQLSSIWQNNLLQTCNWWTIGQGLKNSRSSLALELEIALILYSCFFTEVKESGWDLLPLVQASAKEKRNCKGKRNYSCSNFKLKSQMYRICTSQLVCWVALVTTYNSSSKLKTKRENHWTLQISLSNKRVQRHENHFWRLQIAFPCGCLCGQLEQLTHHWSNTIAWEQRPYRSKLNSINKS